MKAIVITEKGLPMALAEVREYQGRADLEAMREECERNAEAKAKKEKEWKEALESRIKTLEERDSKIENAIKLLLGLGGDLDEVEKEFGGEANG